MGKFPNWLTCDFNWLVKKNFLLFQSWLYSNRLKFCTLDEFVLCKDRFVTFWGKIFTKLLFWKKDKFTNSEVLDNWVSFEEFQIFWDVLSELWRVLPRKFLVWVI